MTAQENRKPGGINRWVRQFNRKITNPLMMTIAGHKVYTRVDHIGRYSNKLYHTPVLGQPTPDNFFIPLPYGEDTDWCRNVMAAGNCVVHWGGNTYHLDGFQIVDSTGAEPAYPVVFRFLLHAAGVQKYVKARKTIKAQE
ncbi:MAG TPA: hypothetical protein VMC62_00680 [Longilinea sp.]|nr:hypothetical protein [Longilinea sp.]